MRTKNDNPILDAFEDIGIYLDKAREIIMFRVECQCVTIPDNKRFIVANLYICAEIIDEHGEYIACRAWLGEHRGLFMSESHLRDFEDTQLLKLPRILNLSDEELLRLSPPSNITGNTSRHATMQEFKQASAKVIDDNQDLLDKLVDKKDI